MLRNVSVFMRKIVIFFRILCFKLSKRKMAVVMETETQEKESTRRWCVEELFCENHSILGSCQIVNPRVAVVLDGECNAKVYQ